MPGVLQINDALEVRCVTCKQTPRAICNCGSPFPLPMLAGQFRARIEELILNRTALGLLSPEVAEGIRDLMKLAGPTA